MQNKLTYTFLVLMVGSAIIQGSDYSNSPLVKSPREAHLDADTFEKNLKDLLVKVVAYEADPTAQTHPKNQLFLAVKDNNLRAVTELIRSGFDLNASMDVLSRTPLSIGASSGCQLPIFNALIKAGADVNLGNWWGGTPLIHAVEKNRVEHVRALLAAKADPNYTSVAGNALKLAVRANNLEIVKMLIVAKAKLSNLLLREAIGHNNLEMVKTLVDAGADVNDNGKTSILSCVDKKNSAMIKFLRSKGAMLYWSESCCIS